MHGLRVPRQIAEQAHELALRQPRSQCRHRRVIHPDPGELQRLDLAKDLMIRPFRIWLTWGGKTGKFGVRKVSRLGSVSSMSSVAFGTCASSQVTADMRLLLSRRIPSGITCGS